MKKTRIVYVRHRTRLFYVLVNQSVLAIGAILVAVIYEASLDKYVFGLYNSVLVYISLLTMICSTPLTGAAGILIKEHEANIRVFINCLLSIYFPLILTVGVIIYVFLHTSDNYHDIRDLSIVFITTGVCIGLFNIFAVICNYLGKVNEIAISNIINFGARIVLFMILLNTQILNIRHVLLILLTASFVSMLYIYLINFHKHIMNFSIRLLDFELLKQIAPISSKYLALGGVSWLHLNFQKVFLATNGLYIELASFTILWICSYYPIMVASQVLSQFIQPIMLRNRDGNANQIRSVYKIYNSVFIIILVFYFSVVFFLYSNSYNFVAYIFGAEYTAYFVNWVLLILSATLFYSGQYLSITLEVHHMQRQILKIKLICFLMSVVLFFVFSFDLMIEKLIFYDLVFSITYFCAILFNYLKVWRRVSVTGQDII